MIFVKSLCN